MAGSCMKLQQTTAARIPHCHSGSLSHTLDALQCALGTHMHATITTTGRPY